MQTTLRDATGDLYKMLNNMKTFKYQQYYDNQLRDGLLRFLPVFMGPEGGADCFKDGELGCDVLCGPAARGAGLKDFMEGVPAFGRTVFSRSRDSNKN